MKRRRRWIWDVPTIGLKRRVQPAGADIGDRQPTYRDGVCLRFFGRAKVITWRPIRWVR